MTIPSGSGSSVSSGPAAFRPASHSVPVYANIQYFNWKFSRVDLRSMHGETCSILPEIERDSKGRVLWLAYTKVSRLLSGLKSGKKKTEWKERIQKTFLRPQLPPAQGHERGRHHSRRFHCRPDCRFGIELFPCSAEVLPQIPRED